VVDFKKPSVLVVMGTYNGEMFLEEQVNSIVNQAEVSITLIIRDDGSTDNTSEILRSFAKKGQLNFEVGSNLGFSENYILLLQGVLEKDWNYLAFSDQDDIWDEKKISRAIDELRSNGLGMYASKRRILSRGDSSEMIYPSGQIIPTFINSCFENVCPGCTIVISKDFARVALPYFLLPEARGIPYDALFYTIAVDRELLYFDQHSFIDYRIHARNTIGIDFSIGFWGLGKYLHFRKELFRKLEFLNANSSLIVTPINRRQLEIVLNKSFSLQRMNEVLKLPKFRQNAFQNLLLKLYIAVIGLGFSPKEN